MYEITVEGHFSAAHSLVGYHGDCGGIPGTPITAFVKARVRVFW
jgi:hypothetical protein